MGGDGRPSDGGGGGGGHPHQFQYQALLAAVHTQGPNNISPFPLPPLNGQFLSFLDCAFAFLPANPPMRTRFIGFRVR
jgi:hypothetical protein